MTITKIDERTQDGTKAGSPADPFLPFSAPWFGPEEKEEILAVLDSDWITTGPRTRRFEQEFAAFLGAEDALAVNSCTAALHLALVSTGIGPGDAVITSPFTFAATANVICHAGARPVFVDIRPDTCNLDPINLDAFVRKSCQWDATRRELRLRDGGQRVRAVIAVHYGGQPCQMDELRATAGAYGLVLIEDAAHAAGAAYRGRTVGLLGDLACFSFYPTKTMSTGEGGMLVARDPEVLRRARSLSLHGMSRDAWKRFGKDGDWRYDVVEAGFKYNMTDLTAALGLHQLRKLPGFTQRRRELAARYHRELAGLPLQLPVVLPEAASAWHLYAIQVLHPRVSRDALIDRFKERNIGCSVHYLPLHLMSFYRRHIGSREGDHPHTEAVSRRILSLPFFPRMSDADVDRVIAALREVLG
jgi:dTDP-4-amino-4,6-dideoxygalactose transaminase